MQAQRSPTRARSTRLCGHLDGPASPGRYTQHGGLKRWVKCWACEPLWEPFSSSGKEVTRRRRPARALPPVAPTWRGHEPPPRRGQTLPRGALPPMPTLPPAHVRTALSAPASEDLGPPGDRRQRAQLRADGRGSLSRQRARAPPPRRRSAGASGFPIGPDPHFRPRSSSTGCTRPPRGLCTSGGGGASGCGVQCLPRWSEIPWYLSFSEWHI